MDINVSECLDLAGKNKQKRSEFNVRKQIINPNLLHNLSGILF